MTFARFARDGANFSVNTDNPTVTGTTVSDEYRLAASWGMTEAHLVRAVSEESWGKSGVLGKKIS